MIIQVPEHLPGTEEVQEEAERRTSMVVNNVVFTGDHEKSAQEMLGAMPGRSGTSTRAADEEMLKDERLELM